MDHFQSLTNRSRMKQVNNLGLRLIWVNRLLIFCWNQIRQIKDVHTKPLQEFTCTFLLKILKMYYIGSKANSEITKLIDLLQPELNYWIRLILTGKFLGVD